MDRCAPLRPGLGEDQRSVLEFESGKRYAPRRFLVLGEPAQPSGDHEVQHQEQGAIELEHDALAHAAHAFHFPARDRIQGRRHAAQHEGAEKAQPLERSPGEAVFESLYVYGDVRKLGHAAFYRLHRPRLVPPTHNGYGTSGATDSSAGGGEWATFMIIDTVVK